MGAEGKRISWCKCNYFNFAWVCQDNGNLVDVLPYYTITVNQQYHAIVVTLSLSIQLGQCL